MRVFLPKSRRDEAHAKADKKRLNKMLSQGHLILTPSRKSDGALWTSFDCNEEDYIVRYAAQREAVIVSTRRFEDFEEPRLQEQVGSGHFPPMVTFLFIMSGGETGAGVHVLVGKGVRPTDGPVRAGRTES